MIEQIRREVNRGLAGMRGAMRGVLKTISLARRIQRIDAEALAGEGLQDMELMQQFGFTSAPPEGSQVILLPLGGRTSATVVIATEHGSYRMRLDNLGEAALYNQWGDSVHLRKDRSIKVTAGLKVQFETPLVEFSGDGHMAGTLTADGDVIASGISLKTHRHPGVQFGGASTGGPT